MFSRNSDMSKRLALATATHKQRAISTPQSRAAIQQSIVLNDMWQEGCTALGNITAAHKCTPIKFFNIEILHIEAHTPKVDALVDDCIEHKGIVRTGRDR